MDAPEYRVQLVQAESAQLGQYLHALPPEAWRRPSACHRWEVRDVIGHLILGAEFYQSVISRGLQGNASPLDGLPQAGTVQAASAWSSLVAQRSVARRESLGDQLLSTFIATSDQLHQVLARCGPQDWETRCYHPVGLLPVRLFVDRRLTEVVMHGWDIRSRLEPEAHLSPESFPAFLEGMTATVGWACWPGMQRAALTRYRFEVTGPVPRRTDIVIEGDQARMEPGETAQANVTFCCATEPFILLLYGRLPLSDAIAAGRMTAEGDEGLIPAFAQWFRGV
jgi:uncharacterized protein (TIGR03083 family)